MDPFCMAPWVSGTPSPIAFRFGDHKLRGCFFNLWWGGHTALAIAQALDGCETGPVSRRWTGPLSVGDMD